MAEIILPRRHYRQPGGAEVVDWANPATHGLRWLTGIKTSVLARSGVSGSGTGTRVKNVVDGVDALATDNNNSLILGPTRHGVAGFPATASPGNAGYLTPVGLLHGAKELTLLSCFVFWSAATSVQWQNFRISSWHTLDVFSQTTSSITFGADWAGAWNGASQKTISNLSDGDLVCIGAVIRQNGARLFANGQSFGTKSGSSFTISTASSQTRVVQGPRSPFLVNAAFTYAHSDEAMLSLTANPWQLFRADPVRIYSLAAALPTLSGATAINITSGGFQPRVTATY